MIDYEQKRGGREKERRERKGEKGKERKREREKGERKGRRGRERETHISWITTKSLNLCHIFSREQRRDFLTQHNNIISNDNSLERSSCIILLLTG